MLVDLRGVFHSPLDQSLGYEVVGNSRPDIVEAEIQEWTLRVRSLPDQFGDTRITVRARGEVDGQTAEDTLALTVMPVNDWPTLTAGIPAVTLQEGGRR